MDSVCGLDVARWELGGAWSGEAQGWRKEGGGVAWSGGYHLRSEVAIGIWLENDHMLT
jgi:hypothetical protein